jgi:uncharacterized protein (TIGR02246 family)
MSMKISAPKACCEAHRRRVLPLALDRPSPNPRLQRARSAPLAAKLDIVRHRKARRPDSTIRQESMNRLAFGVIVAALLAATGCASAGSQTDVQSQILQLDAKWSLAAQDRDVDQALSYWADDAIVFPPGSPAMVGKAAIREFVVKSFQTPGFSISWKTTTVAVSRSGDVAYTTGTNRVTFSAPDGKLVTVEGKAVAVWRRQKDGAWKCVIDIWNDASSSQ